MSLTSVNTPGRRDDRGERHITETEFWNELMHDVYGPRSGGAIVFVDAENARKGVAKTSCAVALARLVARAFRYGVGPEDMTLSGAEYLTRYQEHPGHEQPSVLVLDEFVGAGAGDARRAMSHQNIDFGRAWQLLRAKRVVTFATLPDWNAADPRLQKFADYRVYCLERPIGHFRPYKVTVPFSAGGASDVHTRGLSSTRSTTDRVRFPNMDAKNDPLYTALCEQKDELIHSGTWDADELGDGDETADEPDPDEVQRREHTAIAIRLYEPWNDETATSYEDVARALGEKSDTWVGNRVREWRDGEHRDLVPDPTDDD